MRYLGIPILGAVAIVAALGFLNVSGTTTVQALSNCNAPADANTSAEQTMLGLMNQARAQAGAPALKISPNLQRAALWKSADSTAFGDAFAHTDSLGRDTVSQTANRATDCGYITYAAEDIGWGFPTAQAMFDAFMNSPGHRENIMDPDAVVAGVALVYQGPTPCWTIDFGAVDDSGAGYQLPPPAQTSSSQPGGAVTNTPPPTQTSTPTPVRTVTPTQGQSTTHSTTLYPGVNIVTFASPSESVEAATTGLGDSLLAIYAWQPDSQTWKAYFPGAPSYANDLQTLDAGEAYYLIMRTGVSWQY
jgi:uncharacterized protein YkwD